MVKVSVSGQSHQKTVAQRPPVCGSFDHSVGCVCPGIFCVVECALFMAQGFQLCGRNGGKPFVWRPAVLLVCPHL